jgi:hypothetical protein
MVTILPVPIVYPITKKAGPIETIVFHSPFKKNVLFLFIQGILIDLHLLIWFYLLIWLDDLHLIRSSI